MVLEELLLHISVGEVYCKIEFVEFNVHQWEMILEEKAFKTVEVFRNEEVFPVTSLVCYLLCWFMMSASVYDCSRFLWDGVWFAETGLSSCVFVFSCHWLMGKQARLSVSNVWLPSLKTLTWLSADCSQKHLDESEQLINHQSTCRLCKKTFIPQLPEKLHLLTLVLEEPLTSWTFSAVRMCSTCLNRSLASGPAPVHLHHKSREVTCREVFLTCWQSSPQDCSLSGETSNCWKHRRRNRHGPIQKPRIQASGPGLLRPEPGSAEVTSCSSPSTFASHVARWQLSN